MKIDSPPHPLTPSVLYGFDDNHEIARALPLATGPAVGGVSVLAAQLSGLLCFHCPGRRDVAWHQFLRLGSDRLEGVCRPEELPSPAARSHLLADRVQHDFLHRDDRTAAADFGAAHGLGAEPGHPRANFLPAHIFYAGRHHDRGRGHRVSPAAEHKRAGQPAARRDNKPVWYPVYRAKLVGQHAVFQMVGRDADPVEEHRFYDGGVSGGAAGCATGAVRCRQHRWRQCLAAFLERNASPHQPDDIFPADTAD